MQCCSSGSMATIRALHWVRRCCHVGISLNRSAVLLLSLIVPSLSTTTSICPTVGTMLTGCTLPLSSSTYRSGRDRRCRWVGVARTLSIHLTHRLMRPLSIGFHMIERYGFPCVRESTVSGGAAAGRRNGGSVRSNVCPAMRFGVLRMRDGGRLNSLAMHSVRLRDGPGHLDPSQVEDPHVFLIEYCDGLKGAALMLGDNGYVRKFAYAAERDSVIDAMEYHTDSGATHAVFSYMGLNIEDFFLTGYPTQPGRANLSDDRYLGGGDALARQRRCTDRNPTLGDTLYSYRIPTSTTYQHSPDRCVPFGVGDAGAGSHSGCGIDSYRA